MDDHPPIVTATWLDLANDTETDRAVAAVVLDVASSSLLLNCWPLAQVADRLNQDHTRSRARQRSRADRPGPGRRGPQRPPGEKLWQRLPGRRTLPAVDRLDQLFARSLREIEAHSTELADTDTDRYLINEAGRLLAALRLWAQNQYRSDEVVREVPETADVVTLADMAGELQETGGIDASSSTASRTIAGLRRLPNGQLLAIASCALRAL